MNTGISALAWRRRAVLKCPRSAHRKAQLARNNPQAWASSGGKDTMYREGHPELELSTPRPPVRCWNTPEVTCWSPAKNIESQLWETLPGD